MAPVPEWTDDDSTLYRELAPAAVPDRMEQVRTAVALLPFDETARFGVVELACGEGLFAEAALAKFPHASYLGLDGSRTMLEAARKRVEPRGEFQRFDLAAQNWRDCMCGAGVVYSSLCVHHLAGEEKRRLFRDAKDRLAPGGILLIADLVEPARPEARDLFASQWDRKAGAAGPQLFEKFVEARWNHYRFPDRMDRPSRLFDQLVWLAEAGLVDVDCFWLQAGHAIYGGYTR